MDAQTVKGFDDKQLVLNGESDPFPLASVSERCIVKFKHIACVSSSSANTVYYVPICNWCDFAIASSAS